MPEAGSTEHVGRQAAPGGRPQARSAVLMLAVWRPRHCAWGMLQLIRGPLTRPTDPAVRWRKVLGSGHNGGFGLRPAWNRLGLFCAFDTPESAQRWLNTSREVTDWRSRAAHWLTVLLEPTRRYAISLSPAAEHALAQAPGCQLAVGLGEAPLLRQATFSLWQSQSSMDAYARSGAHLEAIRQAYSQGFFSESMFTRFRVLELAGDWPGIDTPHPAQAEHA